MTKNIKENVPLEILKELRIKQEMSLVLIDMAIKVIEEDRFNNPITEA